MSVVYLSVHVDVHVYVIQEITAEFSGKLSSYFWPYQITCIVCLVCLVYVNPLYTMGKYMYMYGCWLDIGYILRKLLQKIHLKIYMYVHLYMHCK